LILLEAKQLPQLARLEQLGLVVARLVQQVQLVMLAQLEQVLLARRD
jgi:hypothetical protein